MDSLIAWILTFGNRIEILEPAEARIKLLNIVNRMKKIYDEKRISTKGDLIRSGK